MGNEDKLSENDLVLLLEKKRSLLAEFFQWSQKQILLMDSAELESVLDEKDRCIQAMQKTDAVIALWHKKYPRGYEVHEQKLLDYIQQGLFDILDLEEEFEDRLQKEKNLISQEIEKLRHRSQFRNYLGNSRAAGKNLSFRR